MTESGCHLLFITRSWLGAAACLHMYRLWAAATAKEVDVCPLPPKKEKTSAGTILCTASADICTRPKIIHIR